MSHNPPKDASPEARERHAAALQRYYSVIKTEPVTYDHILPDGTVGRPVVISEGGTKVVFTDANGMTITVERNAKEDPNAWLKRAILQANEATVEIVQKTAESAASLFVQPARPAAPLPPSLGEKVLSLVAPRETLEAVLGDFEEKFQGQVERHGVGFARFWYWTHVLRSTVAFGIRGFLKLLPLWELWEKFTSK